MPIPIIFEEIRKLVPVHSARIERTEEFVPTGDPTCRVARNVTDKMTLKLRHYGRGDSKLIWRKHMTKLFAGLKKAGFITSDPSLSVGGAYAWKGGKNLVKITLRPTRTKVSRDRHDAVMEINPIHTGLISPQEREKLTTAFEQHLQPHH